MSKLVPQNSIVLTPEEARLADEALWTDRFRRVRERIREQLPPPKPPESQNIFAVVEDIDCEWWVRLYNDFGVLRWRSTKGVWANYDQLDVVRVLSEGIPLYGDSRGYPARGRVSVSWSGDVNPTTQEIGDEWKGKIWDGTSWT